MDPLALLASIAVSGTIVVFLVGLYGSSIASRVQVRSRLQGMMSGTAVIEGTASSAALKETEAGPKVISDIVKGAWAERLAEQLDRADLNIRPAEYVVMRFILAAIAFVVPYALLGPTVMGVLAALGGMLVAFFLPPYYLNFKRRQRISKLDSQLPEALTLIANSLKAGFGLLQSLNLAAEQMEHPLSTELSQTIHEMNIGSSAEEALVGLSERSSSYDLDIAVTAILVQRTVGGNLAEILDTVAGTMRERTRIRGEIQTLTAQQKLTGLVIGLLPLGVAAMFMVVSPDYMTPLFTTLVGKVMIVMAVIMEVVGVLIIRRILSIEV